MDAFAGELIQAIEERDEPTVVVFYGDHLPTMGLEAKDLKGKYLYNTNYVIWDNIGLEKQDMNLAAYQIMAEVFERLISGSCILITIRRDDRRKIIWQIWNFCSMTCFTENNMYMKTAVVRSQKGIW